MNEPREDKRNVIDYYKNWSEEAIKGDLREKSHNFSVMITNDFHDFNIGTIIRTANAFCAKEVIIFGKKQYDRRGTVGAHLYTNLKHVKVTEELDFGDSIIVGVDNVQNSTPIENFEWPKKHVIMLFGQEGTGLTEQMLEMCHHVVFISQYGSVRSLNVGVASGIAMYDWCQKMRKNINTA